MLDADLASMPADPVRYDRDIAGRGYALVSRAKKMETNGRREDSRVRALLKRFQAAHLGTTRQNRALRARAALPPEDLTLGEIDRIGREMSADKCKGLRKTVHFLNGWPAERTRSRNSAASCPQCNSTRRLAALGRADSADFVADLRRMCVIPHVARKARHSAIDGRTTRHAGYAASQKRRKKIEEPFGWAKTVGGMAQTTLRGVARVRGRFTLTMAACNLAQLPRLLAA